PREVTAPSEIGGHPPGDREHDDVRDDVARRHPGDLVERRAERAHHVRDRHVHDAGVEDLEDRRQRHGDRDDPAGPVRGIETARISVSLRFATTQMSSSGTTVMSDCPACTYCPTSTVLRLTTPLHGARIRA